MASSITRRGSDNSDRRAPVVLRNARPTVAHDAEQNLGSFSAKVISVAPSGGIAAAYGFRQFMPRSRMRPNHAAWRNGRSRWARAALGRLPYRGRCAHNRAYGLPSWSPRIQLRRSCWWVKSSLWGTPNSNSGALAGSACTYTSRGRWSTLERTRRRLTSGPSYHTRILRLTL